MCLCSVPGWIQICYQKCLRCPMHIIFSNRKQASVLLMNKYFIVFIIFIYKQLRGIPHIELTDHCPRFRDTMVARYRCLKQIVWGQQMVNELIVIKLTLVGAVGFTIKYKFFIDYNSYIILCSWNSMTWNIFLKVWETVSW